MSVNSEKTASKKAARFANYPGKVEANLGSLRGPNTLGEYMAIVEVTYNEDTDTTRIGFAFSGGNVHTYAKRYLENNHLLSEAVLNNTGSH